MATKTNEVKAVTLSTGVEVRFEDLNQNTIQDLVLTSFSGMNLQKMDQDEVLQHGDKLVRYNTTLIQEGVYLVGSLEDAIKTIGLSANWMKQLLRSGKVVDAQYYDLDDDRDKEILFLRYHAFKTEEDFAKLTEYTLGGNR
jgi:hypothetical protein